MRNTTAAKKNQINSETNLKKNETMQLLKGAYSKKEAAEIIQQIVFAKVKFYEEEILHSNSAKKTKILEKKIKELRNDLSAFRKAIHEHSGEINMNALINPNKAETTPYMFKLINGTFNFEDAREILMTAYYAKINFHKLKAWSKSERGEVGGDLHTARVLELQIESETIRDLLASNLETGKKINITCDVKIEFE